MESGLSTGQEIILAKTCESIYSGIAHDIPMDQVTAVEMAELATDASRLEMNGYAQEQEFFETLVENLGIDGAYRRIADRCSFDLYEAGGAQAL